MDLKQLGKYRLINLIATGGMGEVYLARMEGPAGFAKNVVVKRVLPHLARDPNFVEMFLNEARLAAILSHPNIVQIFELGEQDGTYFIAMEFVNGRSLKAIKQRLLEKQQIVSPVFAARVCAQALNGLHYAHELKDDSDEPLNIVHRDMSPDNVLVTFGGEVKVVDFGIAKASNAVTTTRTGTLKGKYAYMAPEQLNGTHVDARADIFAMGIVLYELLCGFRPFRGATEPALIQAILNTPAKAPHIANPNVPEDLSLIVLRALQKDPADRYQSAEEMAFALEAHLQSLGQPLTASHVGSLVKSLFPDGEKVPSNPAVPTVNPANKETVLYKGPIPGQEPPPPAVPPPGSSPSLVKPLPKGASSPDLPSPSQVAAVVDASKPRGNSRVLLIAGAFGLGAGLIASAGYLLLKDPPPNELVVVEPPTKQKPAPLAEEKKPPEEKKPVVAVVEDKKPDDKPPENKQPPEEKKPLEIADPLVKPAVDRTAKKQDVKKVVAKNGKVTLRVNPYAEVFFGGKSLGVTPMAPVEVPSGTQTFTLKNPELKITKQVTVKVPPGGTVVLKADLFDG